MTPADQISLQLYSFLQTPWSKVVFGAFFIILILWGINATRQHAYHYAMRGAKFGATSSLGLILIFLGILGYLFVDKTTLSEIISGKRPISDLPLLVDASINRFRFVLGASTDSPSVSSSTRTPTVTQIQSEINLLTPAQQQQLQLLMCRQLLQKLPSNQ